MYKFVPIKQPCIELRTRYQQKSHRCRTSLLIQNTLLSSLGEKGDATKAEGIYPPSSTLGSCTTLLAFVRTKKRTRKRKHHLFFGIVPLPSPRQFHGPRPRELVTVTVQCQGRSAVTKTGHRSTSTDMIRTT